MRQCDGKFDYNLRNGQSNAVQEATHPAGKNREIEKTNGGEPWENSDHSGEAPEVYLAHSVQPQIPMRERLQIQYDQEHA